MALAGHVGSTWCEWYSRPTPSRRSRRPTLTDELRRSWPPTEPSPRGDHQRPTLTGTRLLDALILPAPVAADIRPAALDARQPDWPRGAWAIAVAEDGDGRLVAGPLVATDRGWARADAGDGVADALVAGLVDGSGASGAFSWHVTARPEPANGEQAILVDQTNASVAVGGRHIVKWILRPGPGPDRGMRLASHLAEVGHREVPSLLGWLSWRRPDGRSTVVARVDAMLPDATDGWEWLVDRVVAHLAHDEAACRGTCEAEHGAALGALVARLHLALGRPSSVLPQPDAVVDGETIDRWRTSAHARLEEALAVTPPDGDEPDPAALRAPMLAALDALAGLERTAVQPIHGDLHIGQVLCWRDGLAIIDFDGNPIVDEAGDERQATARDVAQMTCSLDHAGRVADRRTGGRHSAAAARWIATARADFLAAYRVELDAAGRRASLDARLVAPFEVEQECRELIYAARVLPRWRYAPLATLRAWYGA